MLNKIKKVTFCPRGKEKFGFFLNDNSLIFLLCFYPPPTPWRKMWPFISPSTKDTLCQVVNVFSLCGCYLPLEKFLALKLNKFEFPLLKNTLCRVWFKSAQWFWRRLSKVVNIFSIIPLRKQARSFIERILITFTQGCSVPCLVEIGPVVLEKKSSMYFFTSGM